MRLSDQRFPFHLSVACAFLSVAWLIVVLYVFSFAQDFQCFPGTSGCLQHFVSVESSFLIKAFINFICLVTLID